MIPETDETGLFIVSARNQLMKMYSNPFDYIRRSRYEDLLPPWIAEFRLHEDFSVLETESFANSDCQQFSLLKKLNLKTTVSYPRENVGSPHNRVNANLSSSIKELFADTYEWCDDVLGIRF